MSPASKQDIGKSLDKIGEILEFTLECLYFASIRPVSTTDIIPIFVLNIFPALGFYSFWM